MAIPELDLKKVNLQAAVGYLISLHDNEVDWNLLGIKVIGHIDALPIPEGTYEYGDAYMVGTEPPYDMYIYTRPDGTVHTEGYWFPVGKFPMPGPQGPKGDGLEQVYNWTNGTVSGVTYNTTNGAEVIQITTVQYKDSTDGSIKQNQFYTTTTLPIAPGKYISMNANNKKLEVKVDDTELALDYVKIDKTKSGVIPQNNSGAVTWIPSSVNSIANSIPQRNASGDCNFRKVNFEFIGFKDDTSPSVMYYYDLYNNTIGSDYFINKTPTNTGTLTNNQLAVLQNMQQSKNLRIVYDNQVYYRMHEQSPANRTLNYIHLDSIDDGNGGYKAIGKCFSVTVSTRAWKVFDLDFGGSTSTTDIYRHGIVMNDSDIVVKLDIYDNNSQNYTYEQLKAKLALNPAYCANARIKRSDSTYYYSPATIAYLNDSTGNFQLTYNNTEGNSVNVNWTPSVVADNGTQIL